jgi:hypothetical protein
MMFLLIKFFPRYVIFHGKRKDFSPESAHINIDRALLGEESRGFFPGGGGRGGGWENKGRESKLTCRI